MSMPSVPITSVPPLPSIPAGLSYEEFLEWLDEDVHAEWVEGEIIIMSPASLQHQRLTSFLSAILRLYAETKDLGEAIPAPFQMRCAPGFPGREPDLVFIQKNHLDSVKETFVDGPADVAVEIVSRESRTRDEVDKFAEYERGGVAEYWLLDPYTEEAKFFVLEDGKYRAVEIDNGEFTSVAIEGFWLATDWLWQIPAPAILDVVAKWRERGTL